MTDFPARRPAPRPPEPPPAVLAPLRQVGQIFALAGTTVVLTFRRPFALRELIEQFWFIASVTI
ncbi:MAG: hypothetical protein ACRDN0_36495, partial [Trebonia sp.]